MTTKKDFTASDIQTLDQITHVRKRVGMYLGSNSDAGITTGARELLDNSVDEVLGGHGDTVYMRFFEDGSTEVEDHGRGLPVDKNADGINGIILTVGTIGSGGKFSGKDISGGLNGVGASATNATASRFDVTVYRDGNQYELSFQEGRPGFFDKPNDPTAKFTPDSEIKVSKDSRSAADRKAHPTGTKIRFWPDYSVFVKDSKVNVDDLRERLKSTAFLVHGLTGVVEDYRDSNNPVVDRFHFNAGLLDMLPTLSIYPFTTKPIHLVTSASFSEMTNVLGENGKMHQAEVERNVDIDVAFGYTNTEDTVINSYVNIIQTRQHGTHVDGLWRALSREVIKYIEGNKFLKAKEDKPTMEDVRTGFVGIISIKFPEPTFSGQAKEALATTQIAGLVSQSVGEELKRWLGDKKNAAQVKLLCQQVVENKRIREEAKKQKEVARKRTALETSSSMPAKLVACRENDPSFTELQICEGDSALGGLKGARDARYQAIYPLKGKPLNAHSIPLGKVLENQEWSDLIQIIGAGVGKSFDIEAMRYKRIIMLADADADGSHIRTLLIAFFWKFMRPVIEEGRLFSAMPPLFSVTTTGKTKEKFFALNQEELDKITKKLDAAGRGYGKIQRHKGLGEYSEEVLASQVMDPRTRSLRRVTIDDAHEAERVIELAMGNGTSAAGARRDWITESRDLVSDEEIDA